MNTPLRQFAIQAAAALLVLSVAWPYFGMQARAMPWAETSFVIGFAAFTLASLARQPVWWRLIHAIFVPVAWAVSQYAVDPAWFLAAFVLLMLIYRGALSGQVPLYLSSNITVDALEELLRAEPGRRFVDLGAGIGSTVLPLARRLPGHSFTGVENAPLPWLGGKWRTRRQPNLQWCWGDLWKTDLARFDIVYCFLSPVPMADLWIKATHELVHGALFISNSFAVPGITPDFVVEFDDRPHGPLYCYRIVK